MPKLLVISKAFIGRHILHRPTIKSKKSHISREGDVAKVGILLVKKEKGSTHGKNFLNYLPAYLSAYMFDLIIYLIESRRLIKSRLQRSSLYPQAGAFSSSIIFVNLTIRLSI